MKKKLALLTKKVKVAWRVLMSDGYYVTTKRKIKGVSDTRMREVYRALENIDTATAKTIIDDLLDRVDETFQAEANLQAISEIQSGIQ